MQRYFLSFLLLFFSLGLSAQNNEQFFSELNSAWQAGNVKSLAVLFDEEVDFSHQGKERRFSRVEIEGALNQFFSGTVPKSFVLKHKGSSHHGQLYIIGQLETSTGGRYKIVCRAKAVRAAYRIFRLDVDPIG